MVKEDSEDLPNSILELKDLVVELQREKEDMYDNLRLSDKKNEHIKRENNLLHGQLRLIRIKMHARISEQYKDETTVQVLAESDRKPQAKSYSWVFRGGIPGMPGLYLPLCCQSQSKNSHEVLKRL